MARFNFLGRAVDFYGNIKPNIGITIRLTGTSTPATVYTTRTGGTGISTEPQITSDSIGRFNFYVDEVDYPLAGNQKFDIVAAGFTYSDIEIMRGIKTHHALEELLDDDHPQYAALAQNETVTGNWMFSKPVTGQTPNENDHLATKYYVDLQKSTLSDSLSAASDEADQRHLEWANTMFASTSAASCEQDTRLTENILSVSGASLEQDNRERETTNVQILSVSAASHEQDSRERETTNVQILSVSAASHEQDSRGRETTNVQILTVSAASDEADNRLQEYTNDLVNTNILSVSAASDEADNRLQEYTNDLVNTNILSVSAASKEQDSRGRETTNVQILSVSAASDEADQRLQEYTNDLVNTNILSVSAASDEADNRLQEYTNDLVNTNILSVSAASDEADNRLQEYINDELNSLSSNKIVEGNSGVVVNDEGTGSITISADGSTIATFKDGKVGIGTDSPSQKLDVNGDTKISGNVFVGTATASGTSVVEIGYNSSGNRMSRIDLIGDDTYSDYGCRLIRSDGGANAYSQLLHRGTGALYITAQEAGSVILRTNNAARMTIASAGNITQSDGLYFATDEVRARDSGGLSLKDDSGTLGIFIDDGGRVGVGLTDTTVFNGVGGNSQLVVLGSDAATNVANNSNASITIANTDDTVGNTAALHFGWQDTDGTPTYAGASIVAVFESHTTGQYPQGELVFLTSTANNMAPSEKLRLSNEGNLVQMDGLYIGTDEVRARNSGGLSLKDDSGTLGVFIEDGGQVGIGTNAPEEVLTVKYSGNGNIDGPTSGTWTAAIINEQDVSGYNGLSVQNRWANVDSIIFEAAKGWNGVSAGYYPVFTINGYGHAQQADGLYFATDEVRARDAGGLSLKDDAGNLGIFIEDGGQVGIGTNTPSAALDVAGYLMLSGLSNSYIQGDTKDGSNNNNLYIKGAGTNTSILSVIGTGATSQGKVIAMYGGGWTSNQISIAHNGTDGWLSTGVGALILNPSSNVYVETGKFFATDEVRARDSGGLALKDDSGTLGIFVEDGGQVGIGTNTPSSKFEVWGGTLGPSAGDTVDIAEFSVTANNDDRLLARSRRRADGSNWETDDLYIMKRVDVDDHGYIKFTGHDVRIGTQGVNDRLSIDENGKVGIGTDSPVRALEVVGKGIDIAGFFNPQASAGILLSHQNSDNRAEIAYFDDSTWITTMQIADDAGDIVLSFGLVQGYIGVNHLKANYFEGSSGTSITEFSIDGTLAGDSDDAVPTEKAVKTYVDAELGGASSNKIFEGNSGITINDTGTGTINISADDNTIAEITSDSIKLSKHEIFKDTTLSTLVSGSVSAAAWDLETAQLATLTLSGSGILSNPTNKPSGAKGQYTLIITNTGTWSLSYGTDYKWVDGSTPIISQKTGGAHKVDLLTFICDGTYMYGTANQDFS